MSTRSSFTDCTTECTSQLSTYVSFPPRLFSAHTRSSLQVLNKIDAISIEELDLLYKIPTSVPISSREWMNVDELVEKMWDTLDLVRAYTKPRGLAPDYSQPVVLRRGKCTVEDFCNAIHKEIAKQMK